MEQYTSRQASRLDQALLALPGCKNILVDAPRFHTLRVLPALGLWSVFEGGHRRPVEIFPLSKPDLETLRAVLRIIGIDQSAACGLVEDNTQTARSGRGLGLNTMLVGQAGGEAEDADLELPTPHGLAALSQPGYIGV